MFPHDLFHPLLFLGQFHQLGCLYEWQMYFQLENNCHSKDQYLFLPQSSLKEFDLLSHIFRSHGNGLARFNGGSHGCGINHIRIWHRFFSNSYLCTMGIPSKIEIPSLSVVTSFEGKAFPKSKWKTVSGTISPDSLSIFDL